LGHGNRLFSVGAIPAAFRLVEKYRYSQGSCYYAV
jgi:hypothetical protein